MSKIQTKIFNYGDKNESEWPSRYGTGEKGHYYYDKEAGQLKEGYPPNPNNNFGTPAMVIFDSMPPTYHEAACRTIESRQEWELANKETGCITFSSKEQASPKVDAANEKKRKKAELRKASKTALEVYRANPREVKQKLEKQAEAQIQTLKKAGLTKQLKDAGVRYE